MTEDLSVFFVDFGEDATLDGAAVRAIYGAPGATALQGMGMSSDKPRALLAAASIPPRGAADPVLLYGTVTAVRPVKRWSVTETVLDGTGMATLVLSKHPNQV